MARQGLNAIYIAAHTVENENNWIEENEENTMINSVQF